MAKRGLPQEFRVDLAFGNQTEEAGMAKFLNHHPGTDNDSNKVN